MGICTSRTRARLLIDQISDIFDEEIKAWKMKMEVTKTKLFDLLLNIQDKH